jgi:argininosuccinate lyase
MSVLTMLKGLPMTYNRDLQEDKEPLFDAVKTAEAAVACLAEFVPTLDFNREVAKKMLDGGFLEATVMAEYLVEKGLPFREAHEVSGKLVRLAEERGCGLRDIEFKELLKLCTFFKDDIYECLDPSKTPEAYKSAGSAGNTEVKKAIARWHQKLS